MKLILSLFFTCMTMTAIASESSVYDFSWLDEDKEIYVLQNRKFRKKSNVYIGGSLGKSVAGAFIDSYEGNLMGGYFFNEDWGIELSYSKVSGSTNKTHDAVNTQGTIAYYRKIDTSLTAMLMWSPFYSKINTFNKIFYYDWMFGFGLANLTTKDNRNEFLGTANADHGKLTDESVSALTWMTGVRAYITKSWSARIDFRAIHANVDAQVGSQGNIKTEKKFNNYYNVNFGLNYTF